MSTSVTEVVFLKPTFVPQAQSGGIGVAVKAEEPLQLPAQYLVRPPRLS